MSETRNNDFEIWLKANSPLNRWRGCRAYYGDKASIMAAWFGMDAWFEGEDASKAKWATVLKHMIQ
ncbi:hypothetical protein F9K84_20960 [Brucella anthropi]|uniref:hypothetical protein n=1 Tax=Brucella anthropi TaxID=529 RepID=UPI00124C25AC|nr:hypothetical protein [Brucella anthropi]KAB2766017.1 hypothetical protein F9K84_20960 [Brucella anthropi]